MASSVIMCWNVGLALCSSHDIYILYFSLEIHYLVFYQVMTPRVNVIWSDKRVTLFIVYSSSKMP